MRKENKLYHSIPVEVNESPALAFQGTSFYFIYQFLFFRQHGEKINDIFYLRRPELPHGIRRTMEGGRQIRRNPSRKQGV